MGGGVHTHSQYTTLRLLTLTSDTSILGVATVMTANCIVGTINKLGFISSTLHIVQPDGAISLAKEGKRDGSYILVY